MIHLFAGFPLFLFFLLYRLHSDLDRSLSCMNSFGIEKAGSHLHKTFLGGKRFRLYGAV